MTPPDPSRRLRLPDILTRRREAILRRWEELVTRSPKARKLARPALRNHLPNLLDFIAQQAERGAGKWDSVHIGTPVELSEIHAWSRLEAGFDLEEVTWEYALLRNSVLHVLHEEEGHLSPGELEYLNLAIDSAVSKTAELYAQSRQRILIALDRMSELALTGEADLERVMQGFMRILLEDAAIESVSLYVRDEERLRLRATAGATGTLPAIVKIGEGFVGGVAATRRAEILHAEGQCALYAAPLLLGDDLLGVAQIGSRSAPDFSEDDKVLFRSMASRLAQVLANAAHLLRERGAQAVVAAFTQASSLAEAGSHLLREIGSQFGWDAGSLWMPDEEADVLRCADTWESPPGSASELTAASRDLTLSRGEGLPGCAWEKRQPEWRDEFGPQSNFPRMESARRLGLKSAIAIPLVIQERVLGVLEFFSRESRSPREGAVQLTQQLAEYSNFFAERVVAQEALRTSESEKSAFLETALDSIVGMDAKGRVTHWNPAAERTFGYSREEAIGRDMGALIIPEHLREAHRLGIQRYLATHKGRVLGQPLEMPALHKNGTEFWVELVITALDVPGPPIFAGFMRDITELRRASEHASFLVEATKLLSSSLDYERVAEELAGLFVPRVADWCAVDLLEEDVLRRVAITHRDPAKISLVRDLAREHPQRARDVVPTVIRTGEPMLITEVGEDFLASLGRDQPYLEILRSLGLISVVVVPLIARGVTLGALTLVTSSESGRRLGESELRAALDISSRAALAVDNARLYEEEQNAVRVRENVLAVVSHDLRNPLGAISMSAALVARTAAANNDVRLSKHVETIQRASSRMEYLIRDLLDMASIQAGRLAVEPKPEEALSLVLEAFELHAPLAREKGLFLNHELKLQDEQVLCDRERMLQVFTNLIGNAIKFCRPGETITLRAAREGRTVRFEVADTGPGIAEEEFPHLFQPYWSAQRHARKGTGLGLYISKGILEAQRGRVWAESRVGVGTTFFFVLPMV